MIKSKRRLLLRSQHLCLPLDFFQHTEWLHNQCYTEIQMFGAFMMYSRGTAASDRTTSCPTSQQQQQSSSNSLKSKCMHQQREILPKASLLHVPSLPARENRLFRLVHAGWYTIRRESMGWILSEWYTDISIRYLTIRQLANSRLDPDPPHAQFPSLWGKPMQGWTLIFNRKNLIHRIPPHNSQPSSSLHPYSKTIPHRLPPRADIDSLEKRTLPSSMKSTQPSVHLWAAALSACSPHVTSSESRFPKVIRTDITFE